MMPARHSPVHEALEHLKPRWGKLHEMPVALDFGRPADEAAATKTLALCDLSALPRVTIKGAGAEAWLRGQGVDVPTGVYEVLRAGGSFIARTGSAEFLIEDGVPGRIVQGLAQASGGEKPEVYRVLREDAAMLLAGSRANDVMLETCGVDFSSHEFRMVYSRVAGVSCAILPDVVNGVRAFRIWCDASYGPYLWETLLEIVKEKGGGAVGLAAVFRGVEEGL
jgi:sarcosine oxidase subunit gamma